ncbi:MAG: two-component system sensor histidine kinase CreC [Opitutaceae bacterium]
MKIRTAIFGVYVSASAVGFILLMALVLRDVRLRYVESMRRTLADTAAFLGAAVMQNIPANESWPEKLGALPPNADLLRVFACDGAGRVLFDSARSADVGKIYALIARPEAGTVDLSEVEHGELRVAAPIHRSGQLIGWVGVGRPLATVVEAVTRARWRLVWSLGAIAAAMVVAGWWISTKITHSIERLTDYALAVRDGKNVAPPMSRAREVTALTRAFEEMRVALEGKAYVEHYTQALAHELKAPLSSIRGAAELLAENPPEPDRSKFIANLRAESERLRLIVDRLLELAALESRRASVAMAEVELAAVVRGVQATTEGAALARKIRIDCAVTAGARVRGEQFLIAQALGNLVENALEFSPAGGEVTIALHAESGRALVTVEDRGPGVPAFALERVFERFYSLPRPDTGRKSSGLGLSIVHEIARLHGGEVTLENRHGGGARAVFSLPLA